MTKPPKAKIIKAHALADELLAIWQADIRPWYQCEWETAGTAPPGLVDIRFLAILNTFREMRIEVERPP